MARIRKIEITNFRGIRKFVWYPTPGVNCLVGPGDSGKSSILDAIDLCLGARRNLQFTDADFYRLDVEKPLEVSLTLGDLDDELQTVEAYGHYLLGFDSKTGAVDDEPGIGLETAITLRLAVASDLEPSWTLVSKRAEAQGLTRSLTWADRIRVAPTRLGVTADYHLGWRRGSVLNRISEERADASAALARAARDARAAFGEEVQGQLGETLSIVASTANELGIPIGESIKALLDAQSVSFSGGTISLHDENGVPLRGLGVGSTRLLIAGLQRKAAATRSPVTLVDELEYGLEPHRVIRFLGSLGAKDENGPLQVFMTTHSPVAVRELSGNQLFVLRPSDSEHRVVPVGNSDDVQSTIRLYPEALLAHSVIVCEGASEVGFIRGLDQFHTSRGAISLMAIGCSMADCGGGDANRPYSRAEAFRALGYRAAVVRDDDRKPDAQIAATFVGQGGAEFVWRDGRALEDELFLSLTDESVIKLVEMAIELHGADLVEEHIKSASNNAKDLNAIWMEVFDSGLTRETRGLLGQASKRRRSGWFKSVTWMEDVARDIVGPDLERADQGFASLVGVLFAWAKDGAGRN